jgi:recombination protein RecT
MAKNGGQQQALVTTRQQIRSMLEHPETVQALQRIAAKNLDVSRQIGLAMLAVTADRNLMRCTPASIVRAVMQSCQLGLEVNGPLGHAYLVPYGDECVLTPGYRGLIYLGKACGAISSAEARLVYEGEEFEVHYGTDPKIIHRPRFDIDRSIENAVAAYFVARLPDGYRQFEVMTRDEIEHIRSKSRAKDKGPWVTDWGEMARKTVTRRGLKYIPPGNPDAEEARRLGAALELDTRYESGEIGGVTPELDDEASLSRAVANRTMDRLDELKQRMQGQPPVEEADYTMSPQPQAAAGGGPNEELPF